MGRCVSEFPGRPSQERGSVGHHSPLVALYTLSIGVFFLRLNTISLDLGVPPCATAFAFSTDEGTECGLRAEGRFFVFGSGFECYGSQVESSSVEGIERLKVGRLYQSGFCLHTKSFCSRFKIGSTRWVSLRSDCFLHCGSNHFGILDLGSRVLLDFGVS